MISFDESETLAWNGCKLRRPAVSGMDAHDVAGYLLLQLTSGQPLALYSRNGPSSFVHLCLIEHPGSFWFIASNGIIATVFNAQCVSRHSWMH